jgi:hypothetical protein
MTNLPKEIGADKAMRRPYQDWTRQEIELEVAECLEAIGDNERHGARQPQLQAAYARINKQLSEYIRKLELELEYRVTHGTV